MLAKAAPTTRWSLLIFLLVWSLSAVYMGVNLRRGWVPHDEGILAQAAERILHGEMPHRDFNDPYTGGLAYLDASAFSVFGAKLLVLRYVLFAFFLAWVPALFAAAREFCRPWPAAGITLLAVTWSVPNYSAAMPSWFCLFFATFGTLALLKYIRQPRTYLLVLAGLCGGFSFLIKSPGLFFVAGALLFLVYREQSLARDSLPAPGPTPYYSAFVLVCLAVFCVALAKMVLPGGGIPDFLHFVLPALAISILLAFREFRPATSNDSARFKSLLGMVIPFLFSFCIPLLILLVVYWLRHATHELITGLFVFHLKRLSFARKYPPHPIIFIPSIVLAFMLTEAEPRGGFRRFVPGLKIVFAALFLASCFFFRRTYLLALDAAWGAVPVLTVATVALLWRLFRENESRATADQQIFLLLSVTALCSLIQFPFSIPIYFCYVAPLTVLAVAAVLSNFPQALRANICTAAVFFGLFAVFAFRPGFLTHQSDRYSPDEQMVPLALPRAGGLRITESDAALYGELIPFVQQHASGQPILAGPDCPEVYFLAGLRNPTRAFFDSFQDFAAYQAELKNAIDRPDFIKVAVINREPEFSLDQFYFIESLVISRFPESKQIGTFTVYWRP